MRVTSCRRGIELLQQIGGRGLHSRGQTHLALQPLYRGEYLIVSAQRFRIGRITAQSQHILAELTQPKRASPFHRARRRAQLTGQQTQQSGLAGPVDADDSDAIPGPDRPIQPIEQGATLDRVAELMQVEDILAQPAHGEFAKLDGVTRLGNVSDQLVGSIDAELRLGGARWRAATQPSQLLAQQVLTASLIGGSLPNPLGSAST